MLGVSSPAVSMKTRRAPKRRATMQIGTATSAPVEITSRGRSRNAMTSDRARLRMVRLIERLGWQTR
jgi:hypothetical protein